MSKLVEKLKEFHALGCGAHMGKTQLAELLGHIERMEKDLELAYAPACQCGDDEVCAMVARIEELEAQLAGTGSSAQTQQMAIDLGKCDKKEV